MPHTSAQAMTSRDDAIESLFETYGDQMYKVAVRHCRDHHDAQDLVQDTFALAHRNWHQFDGRSDPMTWLFRIAARRCQRMRRLRAGEPQHMESWEELLPFSAGAVPEVDPEHLDPSDHAARSELHRVVQDAIAQLPTTFRMPLVLKEIFDVPIAQIADVLNLQPATVKTRLHRARMKVRNILSEALPTTDAPPVAYSRRVCLDLLKSKQDALDRGVAFSVEQELVCERCAAVFASFDLTQQICRDLNTDAALPPELRKAIAALKTPAR